MVCSKQDTSPCPENLAFDSLVIVKMANDLTKDSQVKLLS